MKKIKILAIACVLAISTNVHAALQSRPGVDAKVKDTMPTTYFQLIREMEKEGGVLGLDATFKRNSATKEYEETSESNSIDSHMMKNTEWGAIAMLSASDYGAGVGNVKNNYNSTTKEYGVTASTTGNMTGVFGMYGGSGANELVAGGIVSKMGSGASGYYRTFNYNLIYASRRYVDNYKDGTSSSDFTRYIPGDATYETKSFGYSGSFVYSNNPVFIRGSSSGIFYSDYSSGVTGGWSCSGTCTISSSATARAAIWVGDGI